jgi:hypothetical protein
MYHLQRIIFIVRHTERWRSLTPKLHSNNKTKQNHLPRNLFPQKQKHKTLNSANPKTQTPQFSRRKTPPRVGRVSETEQPGAPIRFSCRLPFDVVPADLEQSKEPRSDIYPWFSKNTQKNVTLTYIGYRTMVLKNSKERDCDIYMYITVVLMETPKNLIFI